MKKEASTGNAENTSTLSSAEKLNARLKENNIVLSTQVSLNHVNPEVEKAFVFLANQMWVKVNASIDAKANHPEIPSPTQQD